MGNPVGIETRGVSLTTTQGRKAQKAALPGKIERRCPRCNRHAYHWLTANGDPSALKNTRRHTATCVNCGHQWPCRLLHRDL